MHGTIKAHNAVWSTEMDSALRALWGIEPAYRIAELIHAKSKNAVLGRAHRIGLSVARPRPQPRRAIPRNMTGGFAHRLVNGKKYNSNKEPLRSDAYDAQIHQLQLRELVELDRGQCHYPVGGPEGGQLYCAAPTTLTYCPVHHYFMRG